MRIMNVKRAIIILLIIGIMVVVAGCVRGGIKPGETEYQLEITVEVAGEINSNDGIYYIVLDADEDSGTGPGDVISFWEYNYYYIKLENDFFYFAQVAEGSPELELTDYGYEGEKLYATITLSDLGDPSSIDINVLTADNLGDTIYDSLDEYFTIDIYNPFEEVVDLSGDSEDGPDFDIVKVTAEITTLY